MCDCGTPEVNGMKIISSIVHVVFFFIYEIIIKCTLPVVNMGVFPRSQSAVLS